MFGLKPAELVAFLRNQKIQIEILCDDERSIFMLYLKFGNEFGAQEEDIGLAKLNMGYICNSKTWKGQLPSNQCDLKP